MIRNLASFSLLCALPLIGMATAGASQPAPQDQTAKSGDTMVYADFEEVQDNRPVSNGNGLVQLFGYEEASTRPSRFVGMANTSPVAPDIVRLKQDDPNHVVAFDYELQSPNEYAGVSLEVHGHPDKNGVPVPDDLSAYKFLMLQVYATGVPGMQVSLITHGNGVDMVTGYPTATFAVRPGFNTYKLPISSFGQPQWATFRIGTKDVLKKLTSVSITAFCNQCTPMKGKVVVDNIVFSK